MDDFITVVTCEKPCNKRVWLDDQGKVKKERLHPTGENAQTLRVENRTDMREALGSVRSSPNRYVILGFIEGTKPASDTSIGEPYLLISKKKLAKALGLRNTEDAPAGLHEIREIPGKRCATRTISNFKQSSWVLFDYDKCDGMPQQLVTDSPEQWIGWMNTVVLGFKQCTKIVSSSTTSRVLLNAKPAFSKGGWHCFVQVKDVSDVVRFRSVAPVYAQTTAYGFMKKHGAGQRMWTIFDPCVFSPERQVFVGKPVLAGDGLHVRLEKTEIWPKGATPDYEDQRLDTSMVALTEAQIETVRVKTGHDIQRDGVPGGVQITNTTDLKLDTKIETKSGWMTIDEYLVRGKELGKLSCQATLFRPESVRWNGILNLHTNGEVFFFDNGSQIKYVLDAETLGKWRFDQLLGAVNACEKGAVPKDWHIKIHALPMMEQEEILQTLKAKTKIGMTAFRAEMQTGKKPWKEQEKKRKAEQAEKARAAKISAAVVGKSAQIELRAGNWDKSLRQIAGVLHKQYEIYYYNGGLISFAPEVTGLIDAGQDTETNWNRNATTNPVLFFRCGSGDVQLLANEAISFTQAGEDGAYVTDCPGRMAEKLATVSPGVLRRQIPNINDITQQPMLTDDGEVLNKPGYSRGIYYAPTEEFPPIPEHPSQADAEKAARILLHPFREYIFATDGDRAALFAGLLTASNRKNYVLAPAWLVISSQPSTGKTKMASAIGLLAAKNVPVTLWTGDPEERRKKIYSQLAAASPTICFDNVKAGINCSTLEAILTSSIYEDRVLGRSQTVAVSTRAMITMAGNNVSLIADANRRFLRINIVPGAPESQTKAYDFDPLNEVQAQRPQMVAAGLTVLKAYIEAGRPRDPLPKKTIGSFHQFDQDVRGAAAWLGYGDVLEHMEAVADEDSAKDAVFELHEAWADAYDYRGVTALKLRNALADVQAVGFVGPTRHGAALFTSIAQLHPETKANNMSAKQMFNKLNRVNGTWVEGRHLKKTRPQGHRQGKGDIWQLVWSEEAAPKPVPPPVSNQAYLPLRRLKRRKLRS